MSIKIDFGENDNFIIDQQLYTHYQAYTVLGFIKHWIDTDFEKSPIYLSEQLTSLLHVKVNSVSFTTKAKKEK
ncbi:TetR-like C-terminal domain-containing protein [Cytobacillus horneckiae]|uniref:TetR-like C-terminal domain-containing protein n=1 Tax=Cytobacillus horneckiae TaxID=549687 RepID=UPI003D9A4193